MTEVQGEHVTTDIGEAAYLKAIGFVITFDKSSPKILFKFRGDESAIQMMATDYYEFRARVDARTLVETLKSLKKTVLEGKPRRY